MQARDLARGLPRSLADATIAKNWRGEQGWRNGRGDNLGHGPWSHRRATGGNRPPSVPRQIPHLQCHHLEQVLAEYVAHYNEHRPHRGLDQQASRTLGLVPDLIDEPDLMQLRRNEIPGGLIHEYRLAA